MIRAILILIASATLAACAAGGDAMLELAGLAIEAF
jgi:hypothetical protein